MQALNELSQIQQIAAASLEKLRPPPRLTVAEWADQYRYLSPEASSEAGKWHNARAPHTVAPMAALSPHDPCQEVVLMWCSQSGKTEVINNFAGYVIDQDPGPALVIQPNQKPMGEAWSKDRLAPMLRDTPALTGKIADDKGRISGNTIFHKKFPGGHLTIGGANSPAGLASRPIRYLLGDEIDRWEVTKEGSALSLARKRTARFWNRKILLVSSPTYEGRGIEAEWQNTQQHQWQLPCLHCGEYQFPRLQHYSWDRDTAGKITRISYACGHCGAEHDEREQHQIKSAGRWEQINDGDPRRRGYWLNQWGSPLAEWRETVEEFLAAKNDPEKLQAVTNTVFAECWSGGGDGIDDNTLRQRREQYPAAAPNDVLVVTAGIDVQGDRIEFEAVGWGADEESWGIEHRVIHGDPAQPGVWDQLDAALRQEYQHESGGRIGIMAAAIDSGGHHTKMVYDFCRSRWAQRVYAIKGVGGESAPIVRPPVKQKQTTPGPPVRLFSVGVDQAKSAIYARLSIAEPGPHYCHFPVAYTDEWFSQLTAENVETKYRRGYAHRVWVKTRPRNEALDMRAYSLAALKILNPVWSQLSAPTAAAAPQRERSNPLLAGLGASRQQSGDPYL